MGYQVTEFQDTPNPNALKCVLDRPLNPPGALARQIRSYQSAGSAAGDPLAAAIFQVPGVTGVLINPGWVTVTRSAEADWKSVKAGVKKVLSGAE